MQGSDVAWNGALSAHFYHPEQAGRPAYLCVDRETLVEVAQQQRLTAASDPLVSLLDAVRGKVRFTNPTDHWFRSMSAWRRAGFNGPPPFLSILAVTVLAVTTDGQSETTSTGTYYQNLRTLLALPQEPGGEPAGFGSDIQALWKSLNAWLLDVQLGRLGLPTATNEHGYKNIGWAFSQVVMRASDRLKLPQFFSQMDRTTGEALDSVDLVDALRVWARSNTVSRRLSTVLRRREKYQLGYLADALRRELTSWDGANSHRTRGAGSDRLSAPLLLTWDDQEREFGTAIKVNDALAGAGLLVEGQQAVDLNTAGTYEAVPVQPEPSIFGGLDRAASLRMAGARLHRPVCLRFRPSEIRILTVNDELGLHVEVDRAELFADHLVFVSRARADEVEQAMKRIGVCNRTYQYLSRRMEWVAFSYRPTMVADLSDVAAKLSPRGERAEVTGGFLVDGRSATYLTGGVPNIVVEEAAGDVLAVDGVQVMVPRVGLQLNLNSLGLAAGDHDVVAHGKRFRMTLLDHVQTGPRRCSIGFPFRRSGPSDSIRFALLRNEPVSALHADYDVLLSGSTITGLAPTDLDELTVPRSACTTTAGRRREPTLANDIGSRSCSNGAGQPCNFDKLLGWMSERGEGSFNHYRETFSWLTGKTSRWHSSLRNMDILGHLEVDWQRNRWEVAPSAIITGEAAPGTAFLTGARPRWLLNKLVEVLPGPFGGVLRTVPQNGGPSVLILECGDEQALTNLARRLEVEFVPRAADKVLRVLPRLSAVVRLKRQDDLPGGAWPQPMGCDLSRFDPFDDVGSNDGNAPNSYCCKPHSYPRYFFRYDDSMVFESGRGEVVYLELARRAESVLVWDGCAYELQVPLACRLPQLYERAVVLRGGRLPLFDGRQGIWRYQNVSRDFASSVANKLYQSLTVR